MHRTKLYLQDSQWKTLQKDSLKQRSSISNTLRILRLPDKIIEAIRSGGITAGHAKALLAIEGHAQQMATFEQMLTGAISVRQAEGLAHRAGRPSARHAKTSDPNIRALEERLQHALGTKVNITHAKKRGKIVLEYYSHDDLQRLVDAIVS